MIKSDLKQNTPRFPVSPWANQKIGIFGGTFDPIHIGHLRSVEETADRLHLDRIFLIPSALPPHKARSDMTSFPDRLKMTRLAVEDNTLIEVLDIEGKRSGPSYSVDTLENFRGKMGVEVNLFFLLGMDAFLDIESWHRYRRLFELARFVVFSRTENSEEKFKDLVERLQITVATSEGKSGGPGCRTVTRIQTTLIDISSTQIRRFVNQGESIRYLVPESIRHYILKRGLYLNESGA
ncbi:MAG TPA: nicotinate-nucleotide adenylyltransferase [Desulfobacteraceae bacterium]|mgnify:CR=1 FL=1|nr:nicotinate-nucleotide adenylyltransferase [Desulfobacteraceae bacterium]